MHGFLYLLVVLVEEMTKLGLISATLCVMVVVCYQ